MNATSRLLSLLRSNLSGAHLESFESAYAEFVKGTPEESEQASAILENLREETQALIDGEIDRETYDFVVEEARHGLVILAEAKSIRLRLAAIQALFNVLSGLVPHLGSE